MLLIMANPKFGWEGSGWIPSGFSRTTGCDEIAAHDSGVSSDSASHATPDGYDPEWAEIAAHDSGVSSDSASHATPDGYDPEWAGDSPEKDSGQARATPDGYDPGCDEIAAHDSGVSSDSASHATQGGETGRTVQRDGSGLGGSCHGGGLMVRLSVAIEF
jgi:hypothetical protein